MRPITNTWKRPGPTHFTGKKTEAQRNLSPKVIELQVGTRTLASLLPVHCFVNYMKADGFKRNLFQNLKMFSTSLKVNT